MNYRLNCRLMRSRYICIVLTSLRMLIIRKFVKFEKIDKQDLKPETIHDENPLEYTYNIFIEI